VGVVVGSPADESDDSWNRFGDKYLAAQADRQISRRLDVFGRDQQFDFAAPGGHRREVVLDEVCTRLTRKPEERCHAVA
jgi:hypothetical protein